MRQPTKRRHRGRTALAAILAVLLCLAVLLLLHQAAKRFHGLDFQATGGDIAETLYNPRYAGKRAPARLEKAVDDYSALSRALRAGDTTALSKWPRKEISIVAEALPSRARQQSSHAPVSVSVAVIGQRPDIKTSKDDTALLLCLRITTPKTPGHGEKSSMAHAKEWHSVTFEQHRPRSSKRSSGTRDVSVVQDITFDPWMVMETLPAQHPAPAWDLIGRIEDQVFPPATLYSER